MWKFLIICLVAVLLCGCTEFAGGFAAGAATATKLADGAQADFLEAYNAVLIETKELEEMKEMPLPVIRPEVVAAVGDIKDRAKDPITWVALASLLANAFAGGKILNKKNE